MMLELSRGTRRAQIILLLSALPIVVNAQAGEAGSQDALKKALSRKQLSEVRGAVQGTTAVLTGNVAVFADKEEAGRRARRVKGIAAVDNEIEVAGSDVPDAKLQQRLIKAIEYDRIGYGTTPFNAITVQVRDAVVTLAGHAYNQADAASAVSVASTAKGVLDVINSIQVDPLSPFDDTIRVRAFRTIYEFPSLRKYAVDPGKPIRISVQNGQLTLYGAVDSLSDKEAAGLRANSVPGVFKVTNNLQLAKGKESVK